MAAALAYWPTGQGDSTVAPGDAFGDVESPAATGADAATPLLTNDSPQAHSQAQDQAQAQAQAAENRDGDIQTPFLKMPSEKKGGIEMRSQKKLALLALAIWLVGQCTLAFSDSIVNYLAGVTNHAASPANVIARLESGGVFDPSREYWHDVSRDMRTISTQMRRLKDSGDCTSDVLLNPVFTSLDDFFQTLTTDPAP